MKLDVESIIPLGLVMNEMLTNAIKYGDAEGEAGVVDLKLKAQNGQIYLSVADNGQGFPADYNPKGQKSLGMRLIYMFANKLKGR